MVCKTTPVVLLLKFSQMWIRITTVCLKMKTAVLTRLARQKTMAVLTLLFPIPTYPRVVTLTEMELSIAWTLVLI
ncbi:MAG: hypothetical protein COU69_00630 [Candidatus Pacebacteria bacterium CG10_big_fil_rev_8_21_14_0_10_56_10]|nr:MAG: hypothetical protein COU69_00630 [Candidatus Pacebacteria bacterium CG10_big_fil_rev_8_21_14_0_10_56_10]